jgi:hypothetical protein
MRTTQLQTTRRQWLSALVALMSPLPLSSASGRGKSEDCVLQNASLNFSFTLSQGQIQARRLTNKLVNETENLPATDFALELEGGVVVDSSAFAARLVRKDPERAEILFSGAAGAAPGVEVLVAYHLPPAKHYLRKQLSIRQTSAGAGRRLMRADLDVWKGVGRDWKSAHVDLMRFGSHPIYCETLWAGVEFVAAFNEYSRDGFILRSRPGGAVLTSEWLKLRPTVVGVARTSKVRESFLNYIEDIRLSAPRFVAGYNSWWTLPEIFNEQGCAPLIQTLVDSLQKKHGVFFDVVTLDMGWSAPRSIWQVNKKDFPQGLTKLVDTLESAGGALGLWMSPSEVYKPVMDYRWAEENGYEVVRLSTGPSGPVQEGISVADPKYRDAAKRQLQQLIKEYHLGHVKYDGFIAREDRGHQALLPGDDSVEPLAECALELIKASKDANPGLVTEPTFLNSWANYLSPWIIKYGDSVWGNSGGDCPAGLGPAPDYREAQTTAREYFIFASLDEVWLPQNALQYFDIVHCDAAGGFPNHAAMAVGRGRFFLPTYVNPKFMTETDWRIYAGLLKWARANQGILKNTTMLTSRVELGEPYAYAHWSREAGSRAVIVVRNPSNESREYELDLTNAGAPAGLSEAVCYSQFPYRSGVMEHVSRSSRILLRLAPWELMFLEIVPRAELREPVALGARWYRVAEGSMEVASETSDVVRILLPGGGERTLTVKPLAPAGLRGEILSRRLERLPESNWLRHRDQPLATASFQQECRISVPQGASKATALLLLEFPGEAHLPSKCSCIVNGQTASLAESSSAGHIGYHVAGPATPWRDIAPYLSQWTWYLCELGPGTANVTFSGMLPYERCRMGLWAWADWDLTDYAVPAAVTCPEPAMPQYQERRKRQSICLVSPGAPQGPPPIDREWKST